MIELKTNVEYLDQLAADHIQDGRDATGSDLKAAALDHRNLQEYAERLELNIQKMSAEIQAAAEQRDALADILFGLMHDRIGQYIDRTLADREDDNDDATDDKIRQTVKDMIRDGDIEIEVDYSNVELELSINV
jgi:predicted RNA-binding protein Jag